MRALLDAHCPPDCSCRERERELEAYRDDNERRLRAETDITDATPLRQSDAEYLRMLGSYGSRVCRATWFRALAARIEATLAACAPVSAAESEGG